MNVQEKYQRLEDTVRQYNPGANFDLIHAAFVYAEAHHRGQNRKDGSPFITHPLAVAQIVAQELHLDSESIAAALLHDTIEDTDATHEDIARTFSPTIADIVEGVSKLTRVQAASKAEEQMENLRKMLLAMSKDIRVILIKMADRLHNMRTMEYQTPEKQKQKSLETMEIYAPIAHRLGMQKLKWELEDLSLKYLDPIGYQEIIEALEEKASEYDGFMASIHDQITKRLEQAGIQGIVYGRMKHPYSIYRKMYTQNKSLDDVFDLFAFRVIVNTVSECYNVLGIIHDLYKPVLGRFKDYIGTPSPICTSPSTPPWWGITASPLRCRSAPSRCTRLPNTASPPTGSISRTAGERGTSTTTSGCAGCLKIRTGPMPRISSILSRWICLPTRYLSLPPREMSSTFPPEPRPLTLPTASTPP